MLFCCFYAMLSIPFPPYSVKMQGIKKEISILTHFFKNLSILSECGRRIFLSIYTIFYFFKTTLKHSGTCRQKENTLHHTIKKNPITSKYLLFFKISIHYIITIKKILFLPNIYFFFLNFSFFLFIFLLLFPFLHLQTNHFFLLFHLFLFFLHLFPSFFVFLLCDSFQHNYFNSFSFF